MKMQKSALALEVEMTVQSYDLYQPTVKIRIYSEVRERNTWRIYLSGSD
jgi:hypothetical protein